MRRFSFILSLLLAGSLTASAQKSRVLSALQLIENEEYSEAKEVIDLAAKHDRTIKWPRTWYTKGLLCQKAFEKGFDKRDKEKTNLYPDQLYVAYSSYRKALRLDSRDKIGAAVAQQYFTLSNDFQKLGSRCYQERDFKAATRAFEHALLVSKSPLISAKTDSNLVYNTAMAAYADKDWDKAIGYLEGLNQGAYSPNAALLLYKAHMAAGDSVSAGLVLNEGLTAYQYDSAMVLQFVDHLVREKRSDEAIAILDTALERHPASYVYPWTKGLVLQRNGKNKTAIESFERALAIAPEVMAIYYHMGVCYYNMGVEKSDESLRITQNAAYQRAREEARALYVKAVDWLEKAHRLDPGHRETNTLLLQLYHRLQMKDKQRSLEMLIR